MTKDHKLLLKLAMAVFKNLPRKKKKEQRKYFVTKFNLIETINK